MAPNEARADFTWTVFMRMYRTPCEELVGPALGFDTWSWTHGEAIYGPTLGAILEQSSDWIGDPRPRQEALAFRRSLLRAEFWFTRLRDNEVFWDILRWKRRICSRMGYLVPYQMTEIMSLRDVAKTSRYVRIPDHNRSFEPPRGFFVDLPPVLTYAGRELINDPILGVWAIFYTEWVAKVPAGLLWECYDNFRLWWIPSGISVFIQEMDLTQVLGGKHNYDEVLSLVEYIRQTNWSAVFAQNQNRGSSAAMDLSPGKADGSGDWIWFDPWTRRAINAEEAKQLRSESRVVPENHPTGYVFCDTPVVSGLYPNIDHDSIMEEEDDVLNDTPAGDDAEAAGHGNVTGEELASNANDASNLAFLRSILQDSGVAVSDSASMADLRQQMAAQVTGIRNAGLAPNSEPSRERFSLGAGPSVAPSTGDNALDASVIPVQDDEAGSADAPMRPAP